MAHWVEDNGVWSVLSQPVFGAPRELSLPVRLWIGRDLANQVNRLAGVYFMAAGYRRALLVGVEAWRDARRLLVWETREFIRNVPGNTVEELRRNILRGCDLASDHHRISVVRCVLSLPRRTLRHMVTFWRAIPQKNTDW